MTHTANITLARAREERFRLFMAGTGVEVVKPKAPFRFRRSTYLPDFYCPTQDSFYEVLGSTGPTNRMPLILDLMEVFHPSVKLICAKPSGDIFDPSEPAGLRRYSGLERLSFGADLLRRMSDEHLLFRDLARIIDVAPTYLSMVLHGTRALPDWLGTRLEAFAEDRRVPLFLNAGDGQVHASPCPGLPA
jgi:hypothetical protein